MLKIFVVLVWAAVSAGVMFLITLPINLQAHLVVGTVVLLLMIVLKLVSSGGRLRLIALALGTGIILRYVYWRTSSTLPPVTELQHFIPGLVLYLAEMYCVLMLALSIFVVAKPLPSRPPRHLSERDAPLPTVDVFIPSYNEDQGLLANTIAAAKGMDYPADKLTVWLLDDGGTQQKRTSSRVEEAHAAEVRHTALKALCTELGAKYLTRERNEHAKAGNLNAGLAQSNGDLVAVFDADHAPARDFLQETVGYFKDDPKLFLVQTPHFFINPDPLERNLDTFDKMPSENEMFYGVIQRGLDKWNASFFCGSAAVLRRKALEETKGFSGVSITEDCETAISLHARGWNSLYVDRPLIAGLQPATFASFIGQRSRWAQGMMQIMRFHFPLLKRGLTLPQRLCYLSSVLFWFFPFARAIFLIAPLFYLFFDLQIFSASGEEFLAYAMIYMIVNLIMQNYLYGYFRWPWISELYEYIQTIHLLPAILSTLVNIRKPTFRVTAKDESVVFSRLSEISTPFFVIFAILIVGVVVTGIKVWLEPYKADLTLVVGGWNLLNLIFVGCALGVVSERGERPSSRRIEVSRRCEVRSGDEWLPGEIENVSVRGARIRIFSAGARALANGVASEVRFTPFSDTPCNVLPISIRRIQHDASGASFGCTYVTTSAQHHRLIADLVFANSSQWSNFQRSRRVNPGVVRGTLWFLMLSLRQTVRGLVYFTSPTIRTRAASRTVASAGRRL